MDRQRSFAKAEHVSFSPDGASVTVTLSLPDGAKERLRIPFDIYSKQVKGREGLSDDECAFLERESDAYEALCTGLRILSCGGNTRAELKRKLFSRRYLSASVDRAVKTLTEDGYIDEKALLRDEVRKCISKGYGPNKIYARLVSRGFPKKYISLAMDKLEDHDFSTACKEIAEKKLRTLEGKGVDAAKKREKLIVSLKNYGYSAECIRRALDDLEDISEE